MQYDVCIVGGCGHVGLPLGLALAAEGLKVVLYDIDQSAMEKVNRGDMPFKEEDGEQMLARALEEENIVATNDKKAITGSGTVVMVLGTPVDEHLNPKIGEIIGAIKEIETNLRSGQLLILRSTLFPGVTDKVANYLNRDSKNILVAFCPERILEGHALRELKELPQIVAGITPDATERARDLFGRLTDKVIVLRPFEAELAKLMTNTWRYINFAVSNQFYMIATAGGQDFYAIYNAMTEDYPRLKSFAKAGFAAGPCLFKDTMQLAAYSGNNFFLGHSAMLVNEGLPSFVVDAMKHKYKLAEKTVAVLGMAFKGNSDDPRESLSYKLKKELEVEAAAVLCHDPFIQDPRFVSIDVIKRMADIVVIAAPHDDYKLETWEGKEVIDIWNYYGQGGLI